MVISQADDSDKDDAFLNASVNAPFEPDRPQADSPIVTEKKHAAGINMILRSIGANKTCLSYVRSLEEIWTCII